MKNIKDITISIFAIIGFVFILSSFNEESVPQETRSILATPESHVWEMYGSEGSTAFSLNKQTGEVRRFYSSGKTYDVMVKKEKKK